LGKGIEGRLGQIGLVKGGKVEWKRQRQRERERKCVREVVCVRV